MKRNGSHLMTAAVLVNLRRESWRVIVRGKMRHIKYTVVIALLHIYDNDEREIGPWSNKHTENPGII